MVMTGGKRDRMLLESILRQMRDQLISLGWRMIDGETLVISNPGRISHLPIKIIDEYPKEDQEVDLNTLAVSSGDTFQDKLELGSNAETHFTPIYFDFFAESDGLMRHVSGDLYAWIQENPTISIYDYDLATPVIDFTVEVEEESAVKDRPARATNPWQKHWITVSFVVSDDRAN